MNAHDLAREEALYDAIADGYFDRDPYSIYPPPTSFTAPCRCVGRYVRTTDDGESTYLAMQWDDRRCTFECCEPA